MELFNYLLKSSACLVLFFAFYLLVLSRFTFFKINRFYLLGTLLLSFSIPTLHFTIEKSVPQQVVPISQIAVPSDFIAETDVSPSILPTGGLMETEKVFNWIAPLPYLYMSVVIGLIIMAIWRLIVLFRYTRRNTKMVNGLKLLHKTEGFTNCSFFSYVFVDEKGLTKAEFEILLKHEKVHAEQYHSADKIIMMFAKAVLWFNPVIYLWDKALEQVHEYEADEVTSSAFGHQNYASLLLRLVVNQNEDPLIHNFVKKPVKERIKMLFNSKSRAIKKLMYLLTLPIVACLIWSFTIDVVDTSSSASTINNDADPVIGKQIKGVVDSISGAGLHTIIYFKVGNITYPIRNDVMDKVKKGDHLTITIGGRLDKLSITDIKSDHQKVIYDRPVYLMKQVLTSTGKALIKEPEKTAFLYEINQVRYASSKISSIERNTNGYATTMKLNDGVFTIVLDLISLSTKAEGFKLGDAVNVKFIGEKLVAKNIYTTNKVIALYSDPKKHEIINPLLYRKFYTKEGLQKIGGKSKDVPMITGAAEGKVKVISALEAKSHIGEGIVYLKNAKLEIDQTTLEAAKVTIDEINKIVTAEEATIYLPDGKIKKSKMLIYSMSKKSYSFYNFDKTEEDKKADLVLGPGKEGDLAFSPEASISKMHYYASDSLKSRRFLNSLILSGNAKIDIEKYKLNGKVIHIDESKKVITVYFGTLKDEDNLKIEAEVIEIDLANNRYATKNYFKQ